MSSKERTYHEAYEEMSKEEQEKRPSPDEIYRSLVEPVVTIHTSPDCKPETIQALAEMMKLLYEQIQINPIDSVRDKFSHKWVIDLPWHMVDLKDWFYMVNFGYIEPVIFLHVRILGIRSLWEINLV